MKAQLQLSDSTINTSRHPVFHRFPLWRGTVSEGFIVNFLGTLTRSSFWPQYKTIADSYPPDRRVLSEYPPFDEEYFEWIDLLEAIAAAEQHFTMIELGAGWARWAVNAGVALRHLGGIPYTCIAVEAEPTHFRWISQHIADNSLDPANFQLIEAAVAAVDGKVGFHVGETQWGGPGNCYGQSIGGPTLVPAISLNTLLRPLGTVNLIDLDVQGAELEILEAAAVELDKKVKRVHIGTHGRTVEEGLSSLFGRLGWECLRSFECASSVKTEWGTISFQDGVQSWLNPAYSKEPVEVTVLRQKLESSRLEGARLWAELQKARKSSLVPGSLGSRFIERAKRLRDQMAPTGTRRRRLFDSVSKRI